MKIQKLNISNIPVFFSKTDKFKTISIQVILLNKFDKSFATKLSLLTRLMNNTTRKYSTKRDFVNKLYDLYDASVSVYSYPSYKTSINVFSMKIVNENHLNDKTVTEAAFKFLNEVIFNPNFVNEEFNKKEFDEEKTRLKEAIERIYDNKNRYALRCLLNNMCPDEIDSVSSLGNLEDLEKITSKDIYETYNYLINTSNYSVYVVGDIEEDKLLENLKHLNFPINKSFEYEIASEEEYKVDKIKEINEIQKINQSILCMGYRNDFNINHPKYYQSLVFCEMFGGGYISDLFRVVREDNSLAYSIVSQMISDVKLMVIDAGIDKDKYHDVVSITNDILENYKKGIIDEDLLEISKISLISGIEETEDSAGAYIAYMLRNYLANEDLTLEEAINKIAGTTKEDIIEIAKGIHLDTIVLLSN